MNRLTYWIWLSGLFLSSGLQASEANRLVYLDDPANPFYPSTSFPKLTTPQWVGDPGVDLVVTYGIDDMRSSTNYERYLRPILERLKRIDGRAPVSIFSVAPDPTDPRLASWLQEGLSFEVHTLSHPCPLLGTGNFAAAQNTYHGCVDLLHHVPGNEPVAFRTPCCDSIDSASPRVFSELLARTNPAGQFLRLDSSVGQIFTARDPALPAERLRDAQARPRFAKYAPFEAFTTTIENYPYPYPHTRFLWEMPFVVPSDWESFHLQGPSQPQLLEDWKVALDLVALKKGVFNFIFHPANWSDPTQHVAFIDYAVGTYGPRVKFLNYPEVHARLTRHLLAGQPLRARDGGDNGVRLLDLNGDGYLDVVIGNDELRQTRLWDPRSQSWVTGDFPARLVTASSPDRGRTSATDAGARFGIVGAVDEPVFILRNEQEAGAWRFRAGRWEPESQLLRGLEIDGEPVFTARGGRDGGVRLRDLDNDGTCECLVATARHQKIFGWDASANTWRPLDYAWPPGVSLVNEQGEDNGLRFVDLNGDGYDDLVFSNEEAYSVNLMVPQKILGFASGWSREILRGRRGQFPEIPPITRAGPFRNNGAWFTADAMYVQNEDTAKLSNLVARVQFKELLNGLMPEALSPTQSLAAIEVPPNFTIELVAQEPLVEDPVFFDWGEDGRLWVVEMHDYPLGLDGHGQPGGIVRVLEDTDHDGRYDKSTVFADHLRFPNGLIPWRRGVLISTAPEILYAEDTDGDGKADRFVPICSGFREGNQQHRLNGFEYGLDNWLYGANGDSGGQVQVVGVTSSGKFPGAGPPVNISGRDFRFRPDEGLFETVAGQTQFGRHRDDWGNWFGNANPIWLWHHWLPEHYVRRNPRLAVESFRRETATGPGAGRVLSIGRKQPRLNDVGTAGFVTSANSPTPYRDDVFGDEFAHAVFISEPVYNAIRCEILEPQGVSFRSQRWHSSEPHEFLVSSDPWFRPTGMKTGPDGALYVADMYRQFIEHPEWILDDIKTRYNLRAGEDRGRIYRIAPRGRTLRPVPRLDLLPASQLAAALESPNGWQRDTVQRLLVTRADTDAVPELRRVLFSSALAKARLSALGTLDGLHALADEDRTRSLRDPHPGVRVQAVRVCEGPLRSASVASRGAAGDAAREAWLKALLERATDEDIQVRFQLAFTLGEWDDPRAAAALAQLAVRDGTNREMVVAVTSSATRRPAEILSALFVSGLDLAPLESLVRDLVRIAAASQDAQGAADLRQALSAPPAGAASYAAWQFSALAQWLDWAGSSEGIRASPPSGLPNLSPRMLEDARGLARDPTQPPASRMAALQLLGRSAPGLSADVRLMLDLLQPRTPAPLAHAALERLARLRSPEVSSGLLRAWKSFGPELRDQVLEVLFRREQGVTALLDALEGRALLWEDLNLTARQRLVSYPAPAIRERARKHSSQPISSQRQQLVLDYLPRVQAARGEPERGRALFTRNCAPCHRLNQQGTGAAPDLASLVDRSPERMLVAILDPNRAVEDRYLNYLARTKSGDEFSGMLAAESANSITLVSASGAREILLRQDLDTLDRTRLSLMPEGFEQLLQPQEVADLLSFLDRVSIPPRRFPGNTPALVVAERDGSLRLRSSNAEILGRGIAFEAPYQNLGSWNDPEARAAWTLQVPAAGSYEVWLRWACQDNEAGDRFHFEAGGSVLSGLVRGTGTWDTYRADRIGRLDLPAGSVRAWLQPEPSLRGYFLDLLEVRLVPAGAPPPIFP